VISYQELLAIFWQGHNPTWPNSSRQYASVIFYHNEEQRKAAQESKEQQEAQCDCQLYTEIVPLSDFFLAEDYHQKYRLRQTPFFANAFKDIYPDEHDWIDSTAAARLNGYLGGYGTLANLQEEINALGLSPQAEDKLVNIVQRD